MYLIIWTKAKCERLYKSWGFGSFCRSGAFRCVLTPSSIPSPQGEIVRCSGKLQKAQELRLRLHSPQLACQMLKVTTAQLEKHWAHLACLEVLPIEGFSSLRETWQHSFWNKVLWTDEAKVESFGHNTKHCIWRKLSTKPCRAQQWRGDGLSLLLSHGIWRLPVKCEVLQATENCISFFTWLYMCAWYKELAATWPRKWIF